MRISLGESHAVSRNLVNCRGVQVRRAETIGIERTLVIRQDEDNIGASNAPAKGTAAEGRTTKKGRADSLQKIASCLMKLVRTVVSYFENLKVQYPRLVGNFVFRRNEDTEILPHPECPGKLRGSQV